MVCHVLLLVVGGLESIFLTHGISTTSSPRGSSVGSGYRSSPPQSTGVGLLSFSISTLPYQDQRVFLVIDQCSGDFDSHKGQLFHKSRSLFHHFISNLVLREK